MSIIKDFCGTDWYIKETTHQKMRDISGDDDRLDGLCDYDSQTIYLYHRLPDYRKKVTLTHELMHVIYDYLGVEDDEKLVRQLEHHVYDLIKKFPEEYK